MVNEIKKTIIEMREKLDNIDSDKNRFYSNVDVKFTHGWKSRMPLNNYFDDKNMSMIRKEPKIQKRHLSNDSNLLMFNGPHRNYEGEIRPTPIP